MRDLARFREAVQAHRRALGRTQRELAQAMGLHPNVLSHKLHGSDGATLTQADVARMVVTLSRWGALTTQREARDLLALMGAAHALPATAWAAPPLADLIPDDEAHRAAPTPAPTAAPTAAPTPDAGQASGAGSALAPLAPMPLPAPLTPLIGRAAERAAVHAALAAARLVTLTGVGGTGKTRLALEVAREAAASGSFADGVAFVDLAPLRDPALLAATLARALGLVESRAEPPEAQLARALHARYLLLVADNLEHLLEDAPLLARLLAAAPALHVLATSRVPLRLSGEHELHVPPLPLPALDAAGVPADPAASEAVQLFMARARAVAPGFAPSGAALVSVAAICRALDGLPLAIELAAARSKLFPPDVLLPRLAARLTLLTDGPRDRPARQRTLRATLDWSYDLLSPAARALFACLGVFSGPFDADAATAIRAGDESRATDGASEDLDGTTEGRDGASENLDEAMADQDGAAAVMLERLAALADQSLLELTPGAPPRFHLLETVREYALARLAEDGRQETMRDRHLHYYLSVAEGAAHELAAPRQAAWLARLDRDLDNLRVALAWAAEGERIGLGLRLAGALWRFWRVRGHLDEGRAWLERFLRHEDGGLIAPEARAQALLGAAWLAHSQCDYARAETLLEESMALYRGLRHQVGMAAALVNRGMTAFLRGDLERAASALEESVALHRAAGNRESIDQEGLGLSLYRLSMVRRAQGAYARARALGEECKALHRALDDPHGVAVALLALGDIGRDQGDAAAVQAYCGEGLAVFEALGDMWGRGFCLHNLGLALSWQGDHERAAAHCAESARLFRALGNEPSLAEVLISLGLIEQERGAAESARAVLAEGLALAWRVGPRWLVADGLSRLAVQAAARGQSECAARLWGSAATQRDALSAPPRTRERAAFERASAAARSTLGAEAFAAAWAEGERLSPEEAIDEGVQSVESGGVPRRITGEASTAAAAESARPSLGDRAVSGHRAGG